MTDFRKSVLRTLRSDIPRFSQLSMAALGLGGESGEVVDLVKKIVFHEKPFDRDAFVKELGDVRFYLEALAIWANVSMEEIEQTNTQKLLIRYPNGFNPADSARRADVQDS